MSSSLDLQIQTLPDKPGVYQYFDKEKRKNMCAHGY
jgi:excinuclease UvrABC nuclease subunit